MCEREKGVLKKGHQRMIYYRCCIFFFGLHYYILSTCESKNRPLHNSSNQTEQKTETPNPAGSVNKQKYHHNQTHFSRPPPQRDPAPSIYSCAVNKKKQKKQIQVENFSYRETKIKIKTPNNAGYGNIQRRILPPLFPALICLAIMKRPSLATLKTYNSKQVVVYSAMYGLCYSSPTSLRSHSLTDPSSS